MVDRGVQRPPYGACLVLTALTRERFPELEMELITRGANVQDLNSRQLLNLCYVWHTQRLTGEGKEQFDKALDDISRNFMPDEELEEHAPAGLPVTDDVWQELSALRRRMKPDEDLSERPDPFAAIRGRIPEALTRGKKKTGDDDGIISMQ